MFATAIDSPTFHTKHLPEEIRIELGKTSILSSQTTLAKEKGTQQTIAVPPWNKYKIEVEYNYLQQLLVAADRDITEACRMSCLSRARIYQLISKHNL